MEPGEMGQTLKIGSLYFRSSHVRRILILVVIVLILLYWFVLPTNRKASSKSFPVPALVMSDFEPLKIPAGFHYNIDTSKSSLKLENRQFVLKGKPLTILSGAMHYFRVPRDYWRDRMLKMKACGLNTLETYVAWNRHEEVRDQFSFEGNLDLRSYIQLAHELGLYVILRPGPYVCAEWDLGGLPSWLLRDPQMKLRSNYPPYMDAVRKYFNKLLPTVVDLQYNKGGPIIMVQVENEFGSYSEEVEHMEFLAKLLASNGITELLFTSDNKDGIQKKTLNTALRTGNFQKFVEGELLLDVLVRTGTKEPLMIMEFWTGWFDHWGKEHQVVGTERIVESLQLILKQKSSINLYMFHGGTNFGFFAGANHFNKYKSDVTSYDYGAPLSEAGDTTRKFSMMQEMFLETVLKPQLGISTLPEPPSNSAKAAYGDVEIDSFLSWNDLLKTVTPVNSEQIISMEMLDINNGGGQGYGYIVYRRTLTKGGSLTFGNVYDRAQVLMNGLEVSVFDWGNSSNKLHLPDAVPPCVLDIMVENRGRVNYATFQGEHLNDQRKGLKDDVFLSGMKLTDWQIYPLQFNKEMLESIERGPWKPFVIQRNSPTMYKATLKITDKPKDTFVNMKLWKKGVVFVNGFNIGRYWHVGPQQTLYLPAPVLRKGDNTVLVFEEEIPGPAVSFSSVPVLG